jgi:DNA-binding GntR family transcriptional regulator
VAREDARYLAIASVLRDRIKDGTYPSGQKLPRRVDLMDEFSASRALIDRAVGELETDGLVWAVPHEGTVVRYGIIRQRRPRGNVVKRNTATDAPGGYSFPSASGTEVWQHHIIPTVDDAPLSDPRLARLLGVPEGTMVPRRHRVTGPVTEPPFQISDSWVHPDIAKEVPEVREQDPAPSAWLYYIERAGHWPVQWIEYHRARQATRKEAAELEIPVSMWVLEIVRVGRSGTTLKPVEVTTYVIPADRIETVQVLERDEAAREPWPD